MIETLLLLVGLALGIAVLLALGLRNLRTPVRNVDGVRVDFDRYKSGEIHQRGHYQQIVK